MPSARVDPRGYWTLRYRGLADETESQHRVPVAVSRATPEPQRPAAMQALAYRCEEICALLRHHPSQRLIAEALRLGAITAGQADSLRRGVDADLGDLVTVRAAWAAHRTTRREYATDPPMHRRYEREVERWEAYAARRNLPQALQDLTADHVADYADHLAQQGAAWDTRRHALIPLRRAAQAGAAHGIPDALRGERLNRRGAADEREPPDAWSLREIAAGIHRAQQEGDRRIVAVLACGGLLGLRPSEIRRLLIGDLEGDVLRVARRERKTRSSRRDLPIPPSVLPLIQAAAEGGEPDHPLIASHMAGRSDQPMSDSGYTHWTRQRLHALTGRDLPGKWLRHSYATWSILHHIPITIYERYLGHEIPGLLRVTRTHYALAQVAEELRTVGIPALEAVIAPALAGAAAGTRGRKSSV